MRKYAGILLFFVFLLLIVPAFALVSQQRGDVITFPEPPAGTASAYSLSGLLEREPEAYADNRFYLVQNHETGDIMALTPAEYIKGVVAAEMPVSFHKEALKAQAVAAHSYALRQIGAGLASPDPALNGACLSTDPAHFQAYLSTEQLRERWGKNYDANYQKLSDAVDEVIDDVLVYEDQPILAAFHSISSGTTESAANVWGQEVSYLSPVESEGDELSPSYETKTVLKEAEVAHALLAKYPSIKLSEDRTRWFTEEERSASGTILAIRAGDQETTCRELRELFNLKSANFTVLFADGAFTFDCIGYGHGVGMSQYGADYLARQGMSYDEILSHYYTGVSFAVTEK